MNPTNKDAMLWQVADRKLVASRAAPGKFIFGFSPDGTRLITMDNGRRTLQFRRPNATLPDQEVPLAGLNPGPVELEFSGMSPARDLFLMIDGTGVIRIWNTATGQLFFSLNGPPPPYRNAVISPGGKYLALSLYRENIARLYECATGRELQLAGHVDFVSGLAFSPDNSTLATGSMDGTIRLWNTRTGAAQAVLAAHMAETSDVAFSPDGRTLASIGKGESLKLWHVPTLREVVFEDEPQAGIFVRFSPDGRTLAAQTAPDELRLLSAPPE
jgi:WD40 repeat protein